MQWAKLKLMIATRGSGWTRSRMDVRFGSKADTERDTVWMGLLLAQSITLNCEKLFGGCIIFDIQNAAGSVMDHWQRIWRCPDSLP